MYIYIYIYIFTTRGCIPEDLEDLIDQAETEEERALAIDAAKQYGRNNPIIVNSNGSTIGEEQAKKELGFQCVVLFQSHIHLNVTWMEAAFQEACHQNKPPQRLHRAVVNFSLPLHIVARHVCVHCDVLLSPFYCILFYSGCWQKWLEAGDETPA